MTAHYTDDTDAGKTYPCSPVKSVNKILLAGSVVLALALPAVQAQREKLPPDALEYVEKTWPDAKKTQTGIRYIIQREGQGDTPKPGDKVNVLYVGRLLDGTIFDQNTDAAQPFLSLIHISEPTRPY